MAIVASVFENIRSRFVGTQPVIADDFPVTFTPDGKGDVVIKNVDGMTMYGAALFLVTGLIDPQSVGHDKNSVFYHTIKKAIANDRNDLGPFLVKILREHTRNPSVVGLAGEICVIRALRKNRLGIKLATIEQDLYDDIDLYAGSLQIPVQVKTTTAQDMFTSVFEHPAEWYRECLLFLQSKIRAYFGGLKEGDEDKLLDPRAFYQDLRAESSSFITICGKGQEIPFTWQNLFNKLAVKQPHVPAVIQRMFEEVYRFEQLKKRDSQSIMILVNAYEDIDWNKFRFTPKAEQYLAKLAIPAIEKAWPN